MRKAGYLQWLKHQPLQETTIRNQISWAGRVEQFCGDLDEHYENDGMTSLIQLLTYTADDEHRNRPNPTPIPFEGNCRTNLSSYRNAVGRYRTFRKTLVDGVVAAEEGMRREVAAGVEEEMGQRIGLERDMQAALRTQIEQIESGLTIVDDGAERSVESGFIDITARDSSGNTVVIELKAGAAGRGAIGQILSYMGDVATEEDGKVRGILVASEFNSQAKAAARMVPNLILRKYSVRFMFSDGHA